MPYRISILLALLLLSGPSALAHDPGLGTLEVVSAPSGRIDLTLTFAEHDLRLALAAREVRGVSSRKNSNDLSETRLRALAKDLIRLESGQSGPFPPALRLESVDTVTGPEGRHVIFSFLVSAAHSGPSVLEVPILDDFPRGYRLHVTAVDAKGSQRAALLHSASKRFLLSPPVTPETGEAKQGAHPSPSSKGEPSKGYNSLLFLPTLILIGLLLVRGWRPASRPSATSLQPPDGPA